MKICFVFSQHPSTSALLYRSFQRGGQKEKQKKNGHDMKRTKKSSVPRRAQALSTKNLGTCNALQYTPPPKAQKARADRKTKKENIKHNKRISRKENIALMYTSKYSRHTRA